MAPKKMASSILTRSAKGKAGMESSTTVTTRSSARIAKGKAKMESNLTSAGIQSPPKSKKTKLTISDSEGKSKKRANVQISTRSSTGKAKEEEPPRSKKAKTAIFDGSTSSSTILTRRSKGKAKLGSDSTAARPLPPKSNKAKTTTSGGNSSVTIRANVEPSSIRVTRSSTRNS